MKLNHTLLKNILSYAEGKDGFVISTKELFEGTRSRFCKLDEKMECEIFFGHLLVLVDTGIFQELSCPKSRLGISYSESGFDMYAETYIRMTATGYEILKALNDKVFFEKAKHFSIEMIKEESRLFLEKIIL